jgi:hypothetical protein
MSSTVRIALWSGPRNISTALMYAFAQRADTTVVDEPLYAHYLSTSPARQYHPGADEVIAWQENDWRRVVESVFFGPYDTPIVFFKNMTHHLVNLEWDFLLPLTNVLLTRDPRDMLLSYVQNVQQPTLQDTGYADHLRLLNYLNQRGKTPPILEARRVLQHPSRMLAKLCYTLGIPYDPAMLTWEAGPRPEDGVWAKYWYASVHRSTGFHPYAPKQSSFPEHLEPLLAECRPYYQRLAERALDIAPLA